MDSAPLHASIEQLIGTLGLAIDVAGVIIIVTGIAWSTAVFALGRMDGDRYESFKMRIGRSLLLGLEMLVAADIVKTIALTATLESLGILAALVAIRTFLSWSLTVEIEGSWPWQPLHPSHGRGTQ